MTGVTPTCPQGPCWDRESVRTQQQVPRAGGVAGVQGACCGSLLAWASAPLLSVSEGVLGSHFRVGRGGAGWREQQDVAFAATPTDTSCLGQERGAPWHPQSQEIRYGEEVACPGLLRAPGVAAHADLHSHGCGHGCGHWAQRGGRQELTLAGRQGSLAEGPLSMGLPLADSLGRLRSACPVSHLLRDPSCRVGNEVMARGCVGSRAGRPACPTQRGATYSQAMEHPRTVFLAVTVLL